MKGTGRVGITNKTEAGGEFIEVGVDVEGLATTEHTFNLLGQYTPRADIGATLSDRGYSTETQTSANIYGALGFDDNSQSLNDYYTKAQSAKLFFNNDFIDDTIYT